MARTDLVRHQLFLPRPLSERLDELARGPGASRSKILAEALAAFLERKGSSDLELAFATRLDRLSRQLERVERNGRIELESLALFVRYMLAVNAPLPEDETMRALSRDRFNAFVARVGQQIASGKHTLDLENDK